MYTLLADVSIPGVIDMDTLIEDARLALNESGFDIDEMPDPHRCTPESSDSCMIATATGQECSYVGSNRLELDNGETFDSDSPVTILSRLFDSGKLTDLTD